MSDLVDPDAGGYPPVEFLDIGPMNSALSDPPLSWAYYHGDIGDVQPLVDRPTTDERTLGSEVSREGGAPHRTAPPR